VWIYLLRVTADAQCMYGTACAPQPDSLIKGLSAIAIGKPSSVGPSPGAGSPVSAGRTR